MATRPPACPRRRAGHRDRARPVRTRLRLGMDAVRRLRGGDRVLRAVGLPDHGAVARGARSVRAGLDGPVLRAPRTPAPPSSRRHGRRVPCAGPGLHARLLRWPVALRAGRLDLFDQLARDRPQGYGTGLPVVAGHRGAVLHRVAAALGRAGEVRAAPRSRGCAGCSRGGCADVARPPVVDRDHSGRSPVLRHRHSVRRPVARLRPCVVPARPRDAHGRGRLGGRRHGVDRAVHGDARRIRLLRGYAVLRCRWHCGDDLRRGPRWGAVVVLAAAHLARRAVLRDLPVPRRVRHGPALDRRCERRRSALAGDGPSDPRGRGSVLPLCRGAVASANVRTAGQRPRS